MDLVGIKSTALDEWSHQLFCPWCGEDAWAVSDYYQCFNPTCAVQAASAEDLLSKYLGGYASAAHFVASLNHTDADEAGAHRRARERAVMDLWIELCLTPHTSAALHAANRLQGKGFGIRQSRFNATVLDTRQTSRLIDLAEATGATMPEAWATQRPGITQAFCVQTRPHTIDRIVLVGARGREEEIIWNNYSAGICSMIGMTPRKPRLVVADVETMLRLQHDLAAAGRIEEVSSVHLDLYRGEACPRWDVQTPLMIAVTRHCQPQQNDEYFGPQDVVRMQQVFDQFPGMERNVLGLPIDTVREMRPRRLAVPWHRLRFGLMASMIPPHANQVTPACASIFELTGTRPEDATALIEHFKLNHRHQVAEDFELLSLTRIISRDARMTVKETANDYRIIHNSDTALLTNFSLKIHSGVSFRHHAGDRYCQAQLRCGAAVMDVLFPQNMLHDRIQSLEEELQRQITAADLPTDNQRIPTVIEVSKFRNYIVPHLRRQAAQAKQVRGVDLLGWSEDRRSFTVPGFVVSLDAVEETGKILCPAVPVLRRYKPIELSNWSETCPPDIDQSCHDIVAMLVASCVRYFRRCVTNPIQIAQSSTAMTVLDKIMKAFGQAEIYTINHNVRDGGRIEGVHGYPLLATGPRVGMGASQIPFLHLTDQGYKFPSDPDPSQAEAGARAAQFFLKMIVEWCISTGGDDFREIPSLQHYRSLLREGRWLIETVGRQDEWSVSQAEPTAIEKLLSQIPYSEAGQRMTLIDGQHLVIDVHGLERDHDGILREARDMGTLAALEEDKIMSPAAKLLPAISTYYGQDPDVTVITT